jgi:hypothetical protein
MLVNVKLYKYDDARGENIRERLKNDPHSLAYLEARAVYNQTKPEVTGIYLNGGTNFEHEFDGYIDFDHNFPALGEIEEFADKKFGSLNSYGVADNIEQVLALYKEDLNNPNRKFCIATDIIYKSDQSEWGGWRWEKWGRYIGTHHIQSEYLYHETGIDQVMLYHIYEIPDNLVAD